MAVHYLFVHRLVRCNLLLDSLIEFSSPASGLFSKRSAAIKIGKKVYTGYSHPSILIEHPHILDDPRIIHPDNHGFVTKAGKFVTRKQAATLVKKAGHAIPIHPQFKPTDLHTTQLDPGALLRNPITSAVSKIHKKIFGLNSILHNLIEFRQPHQPHRGDEKTDKIPFKEGQVLDYTVQRHQARRAGPHRDIRIGDRLHGLLSWATRKDLPGEGGKIAIHPQPVHPHSYLGWSGKIKKGYGAGDVRTEHLGKALVTKATPDELHATLAGQRGSHRIAFIKSPHGWLLARGKHPEPPPEAQKPSARSIHPKQARQFLSGIPKGTSVQPKIDGALSYITIGKRPEIFSHRKSSRTGTNVVHTERFWGGRPTLHIPRKFHGHTLISEVYGTRNQRVIPPQTLGGVLNSNIAESLHRQHRDRIKLKAMPFDIVGDKTPYRERLQKVQEIVKHLPSDRFHAPEEARTPKAAKALFDKIRSGRHPLTREGVVAHLPAGKMIKVKNTKEENVKIHSLFPGKGKFLGHPGGFVYSDKHGRALGRVGTGFTDQTRSDLPRYIGRSARVRHQGRFRSGRLRAPSFIGIDES